MAGSFVVANVGAGSYTVTATGSPTGDSATATFQLVTTSPTISINPTSAQVGSSVIVSGSGFSPSDTGCTLTGSVVGTSTCTISSGTLSASFIVASVGSGSFTITVTGSTGDSASVALTVGGSSATQSILLNPVSGPVGSSVVVSGSGFSPSDTGCSLSGSAVGTSSCLLYSGTLTGSFVVANVAAGSYAITAVGSTGDSASATFTVGGSSVAQYIVLNPVTAPAGTTVTVSGSGFSTSDIACTLSGTVIASQSCTVSGGTLTGSFVVANVLAGVYTITATGSVGDSASASFTVGALLLDLSCLILLLLRLESTVTVSGSGFSTSDSRLYVVWYCHSFSDLYSF